jgi:uncharacterized membrane protein
MTAARRARNERRSATRAGDVKQATAPDPAIAARRAISARLLRGFVLIILTASGLLLVYGAIVLSPYSQAYVPPLTRAIIAHAVLAGVYAWYVRTGSRFIPLAVSTLAAAALLAYLWQIGSLSA